MDGYTHLMLSGGGYLGYVYIGVYRFLKEYKMLDSIKHLYGTSIGAFFAFLFGLNISYERMEEIFMPGGDFANPTYHTYDPAAIVTVPKDFGIFTSWRIRTPLSKLLEEVFQIKDITFQEYLKKTGKDLHINATCLEECKNIDFCNDTHPDMSVLTAIEASSAIPFIFKPQKINQKHYVDGATMNNFPLHFIPDIAGVKGLGFNILFMPLYCESITNFYSYATCVFNTILNASYQLEVKHKSFDIINFDQIPIKPCSFHPTSDKKYHVYYSKEEVEKAIYYAYQETYKFFFANSTKEATVLSPS